MSPSRRGPSIQLAPTFTIAKIVLIATAIAMVT